MWEGERLGDVGGGGGEARGRLGGGGEASGRRRG